MTVAAWQPGQCPKCRSANGVELDANTRLCLDCRAEWNPATTFGPDTVPLALVPERSLGEAMVRSLLSVDTEPADQLTEVRSRYLGAEAMVHEVDAVGTISEVDDNGLVTITFGSGFYMVCSPDEFTVTDATVLPDDQVAALAATDIQIASRILLAGAETFDETVEPRRLGMPPDGYLPDDPGVMPVIEHGAAYAIGVLAMTVGMSTDDLRSLAQRLDEAADAAKGANNP